MKTKSAITGKKIIGDTSVRNIVQSAHYPISFKSAITGKFVSKKAAAAKPKTTFAVNDYPARMLRKLVRLIEATEAWTGSPMPRAMETLIANVKKKMGWK